MMERELRFLEEHFIRGTAFSLQARAAGVFAFEGKKILPQALAILRRQRSLNDAKGMMLLKGSDRLLTLLGIGQLFFRIPTPW
jgi:hypothetical protein